MLHDVDVVNKRCLTCIRNGNHHVSNHPAFSNTVSLINDEVSIDFSGGYPETVENYSGVMLVINTATKFVKIFKVKGKTEQEIANRLIVYFCTFGPVLRILSDNEPGLISAIDKLKTSMGIEWHKTGN